VFIERAGPPAGLWASAAALLGALTIVGGNLMAIPQTDAKRLLAYSGIAHIGYMLLGVAALSPEGAAMLLFYLVAYLFSNMGAFMVVEAVARTEGSSALRTFRGLAQRSPVLALAMLLFLLSLGGIPFVVGFWAKLYVLWAAAQAGLYGLVLLAAVLTVVALFYYLLVAKQMYIDAPARPTPVPVPPALLLVLLVSALAVVGLGLYPGPLVDAAMRAAAPLF
jgi:NADH-quinone oxidoreductase subunit N